MTIQFKETRKNNHLTKYDGIRQLVIDNYVGDVPQVKKGKIDHKKQTLLSEH